MTPALFRSAAAGDGLMDVPLSKTDKIAVLGWIGTRFPVGWHPVAAGKPT